MNPSLSIQLQVKYLSVKELQKCAQNPRKHSKKQINQICESIKTFGFLIPVLIDGDNLIIAGHGRILAAEKLEINEVPTIQLNHLTEDQRKAFMIADNKLTENGEWDVPMLASVFKEIHGTLDFGLDITGFEMPEINMMIEEFEMPGQGELAAADVIPEAPDRPPVSKQGDLWLLGQHRLLCGNSLEGDSFVKLMDGAQALLIFTDPPYNVPIKNNVSGKGAIQHREFCMASGEMTSAEFTDFLRRAFSMLADNSRDGAIHFICMDWRHLCEILGAGSEIYQELKNMCVWKKDNAGMGTFYRNAHELVFAFKKGTAAHKNNFKLGQYGRYRTNVWEYPGASSFARKTDEGNLLEMHPTVKPVAMVADAIRDCSDIGDIVLDSFLGSGTTMIAAERTSRICYGMELDPVYVDTAIRRWQAQTGKDAVHAESGQTFNAMLEGDHE